MTLFVELADASIAPLTIQNRILCLTLRLVDRDRDEHAMLADVFLELLKLIRIEEQTGVVGIRLDFFWGELHQCPGRDHLRKISVRCRSKGRHDTLHSNVRDQYLFGGRSVGSKTCDISPDGDRLEIEPFSQHIRLVRLGVADHEGDAVSRKALHPGAQSLDVVDAESRGIVFVEDAPRSDGEWRIDVYEIAARCVFQHFFEVARHESRSPQFAGTVAEMV